MKIKKGDQVVVVAGVNKGAKGEVLEVYPGTVSYTHLRAHETS